MIVLFIYPLMNEEVLSYFLTSIMLPTLRFFRLISYSNSNLNLVIFFSESLQKNFNHLYQQRKKALATKSHPTRIKQIVNEISRKEGNPRGFN